MERTAGSRRACAVAVATLASILLAGAVPPSADAVTRYVDDSGSDGAPDTNPCTDPSAPCKTVTNAASKATSGDTIDIAAGIYSGSVIPGNKLLHFVGDGPGDPGAAPNPATDTHLTTTIGSALHLTGGGSVSIFGRPARAGSSPVRGSHCARTSRPAPSPTR